MFIMCPFAKTAVFLRFPAHSQEGSDHQERDRCGSRGKRGATKAPQTQKSIDRGLSRGARGLAHHDAPRGAVEVLSQHPTQKAAFDELHSDRAQLRRARSTRSLIPRYSGGWGRDRVTCQPVGRRSDDPNRLRVAAASSWSLGEGFMHVQHRTEVSSQTGEYKVCPKDDLVPVCPNCHAMLHWKAEEVRTIEQLRSLMGM